MTDTSIKYTMDVLFAGNEPGVRDVYDRLMAALAGFGPVGEEPKKTSIHLVHKSGFAGVHLRKGISI